jgi:hypothetical protein
MRSRREFLLQVMSGSSILGLTLLGAGCAKLSGRRTPALDAATDFNAGRPRIKLAYATDSGRLNLLALAAPPTEQLVTYQATSPLTIPEFARCRLALVSPHPQGKAGYAMASLVVLPQDDQQAASTFGSLWSGLTGDDSEQPSTKDLALEVWAMELPQWQVEQLVERLKKDDFFKRQRVFDAEVQLATEINGTRFAKPAQPIAELDGLIFRIRREGRLLRRKSEVQTAGLNAPNLPELLRLPPVGP